MADLVYLDDSFNFFNQGSKYRLVWTSNYHIQKVGPRMGWTQLMWWTMIHFSKTFIFCDFSNFLFDQKNWFVFRFSRFISKSSTIKSFPIFSPIAAFNYRLHVLVDRQVRIIFCNRTNFNTFHRGDKTYKIKSTIKPQILQSK